MTPVRLPNCQIHLSWVFLAMQKLWAKSLSLTRGRKVASEVRVSGKSRPSCPQSAVPLAGPPPGPASVTVRIRWHLAVRLFLLGVRRRLEFWVGIQHLPSSPATSGPHIPTRQATLPCLGFEPSVIIPSLL